jgi:hypothetical protein
LFQNDCPNRSPSAFGEEEETHFPDFSYRERIEQLKQKDTSKELACNFVSLSADLDQQQRRNLDWFFRKTPINDKERRQADLSVFEEVPKWR